MNLCLLLQIGLLRFSFPPFPISDEDKSKLTMHMTSATHTKRAAKRATLLLIEFDSPALSFFVVVVDIAIPSPTRNPALPPIAFNGSSTDKGALNSDAWSEEARAAREAPLEEEDSGLVDRCVAVLVRAASGLATAAPALINAGRRRRHVGGVSGTTERVVWSSIVN